MTIEKRHAALAEANRAEDRAAYFESRGDTASAEKQRAIAAALRASLR